MSSDRTKQICLWMTIYMYIYIYETHFKTPINKKSSCLVWLKFDGISTIVGYLKPNPLYTYILNIYDLV